MFNNDVNKINKVEAFMVTLDHPLKAEVQAIREIILKVNKNIVEEIKWHAPTFKYKGYLATFGLRDKRQVRLVFPNGAILNDKSGLLVEVGHLDERLAYFSNMEDV